MIPTHWTGAEFDQFRARVDAYCADRIDAAGFAQLEADLVASPEARRYFLEYVQLHAEIGFATRAGRAATLALDRFEANGATGLPAHSTRHSRRGQFWRIVWMGLAASLVLVGVGRAVIPRGGGLRLVFTPTSTNEVLARPLNVAWLVNAQNCRWVDPEETPGRTMTAGKFLRLESGLAEVEFDGGARVILQGPATLELIGGNRAHLIRGAMTAKVPPQANGFSVVVPSGQVVDLGAEFGLATDASGQATSVRVFAGMLTASASRDGSDPIWLKGGQEARIEANAVVIRPAVAHQFTRAIVPPPAIHARTLRLDFKRPIDRSILDSDGFGLGLTSRLPGTGAAFTGPDPNLRLRTDLGVLELTTTRSDLNSQVGLEAGEYFGVKLADLGFTGAEDFTISASVPNIPGLDVVGQFGLYAGSASNRAIRGGVIRQPQADKYSLFLVNNGSGIDVDINEVGLTTTGDDLRFTLQRVAGRYALLVENLTRQSSNTLTIAPSSFLDGRTDLAVGLFGANTQSDTRKTLTITQVEITVFTQLSTTPALAHAESRTKSQSPR